MSEYYDALESRDPALRQAELIQAVAAQVRHAQQNSPAYADILADVEAHEITSPAAIAALPVMRKSALSAWQQSIRQTSTADPFGGLAAYPAGQLKYLFSSPGPIYQPATFRDNYWRFARAMFAAGLRRGHRVQCCFSYHLTPAGAMGDSGGHALGCEVIPAGVGQTASQVAVMADLKPDAYFGTPSFLKIILARADQLGADVASVRMALLSGEALPPSMRRDFAARGIAAIQAYATAELGLIAYESIADQGLIVDEAVYVEIVAPGGDKPVADGDLGEVVVTTLNPDYPLIRFATGDLSAFLPDGISPCGRTNRRLAGWLGRADQAAKVRGMFIHPAQIQQILARHGGIGRARMVVDWHAEADRMTLKCETAAAESAAESDLKSAITATIRELCKVRGEVELVAPGTLPTDGILIEDRRQYD